MSKKKIALASCAATLAAAALWALFRPGPGASSRAPDFQLSDPAGKIVSLSQFRGRPVLVNFWATWCPPCRAEIPGLEAVYERLKSSGFVILGVSVDGGKNTVLQFLAGSPITYPVLLCDPETADAYHIYELPTSFLIAPNGRVARQYVGPIDPATLENDILNMLGPSAGKKT